jgi:hypothetical protein
VSGWWIGKQNRSAATSRSGVNAVEPASSGVLTAEGCMEPDWTASYCEALESFHREPQHTGCKPNAGSELEPLARAMLNQNLHQFFLLAPTHLRNELFTSLFARRFSHPLILHRSNVDGDFDLENAMRPDLLFVSDTEAVAMEIRLGRAWSLAQVHEYALMALALELQLGSPRRHCFALIDAGDFRSQWKGRYSSVTELKIALSHEDPTLFLRAQAERFHKHEERFMEIVVSLDLAFLSFADLAASIRDAAPSETDMSPGAEVYRKLIAGMLAEFDGRRLVE